MAEWEAPARALERAIAEFAAQRPISRAGVAELADRAGVGRATVYNRYDSPLDLFIQVLYADLEPGHRWEEQRQAEGGYSAEEQLRLATGEVADHMARFRAVYRNALADPADRGVYEALVRHFIDYRLAFMARITHPDLPAVSRQVVAQFVSHGFAGAIEAWLRDASVAQEDLVDAVVACAPVQWG
ncbi:TetR/AcrR family transcriptional regulator [Streptomyces sp. NBC_01136]|uniref:TetR/AcrR family transcriptional regulator n=1 Tax=unclassified Streptomyces TaxID=2593676 RepID=UPI0032471756|nr:TetR/AcrR family transcriptional regulator [Streptomyces sp. NBC_01136]